MGELLEGTATGGKMRVVGLFDDDPKKIGLEYTRVIAHSRSKGMARLTMRPSLLEGEGAEAEAEAKGRMTLPLMKVFIREEGARHHLRASLSFFRPGFSIERGGCPPRLMVPPAAARR